MASTDKLFAGSIPAIYDRCLGPLIFEPYARDLARRLEGTTAGRILEVAAGTGIVTHALAEMLPPRVAITTSDLNQPMLDFAAGKAGLERVTWRQADALHLPFADQSFDTVICQFGVMFFPNRPAAYRETLRVLKPGGWFLFNVWDRIADNEFADAVTTALAEQFPADPPRFLSRIPHGYHDLRTVRADLRAAGFEEFAAETIAHRSHAASHRDPAVGFCQGTPLRNEIEARDKNRLLEATDAAASVLAKRFGAGPIDGKIQAHVIETRR